MLTWNLLVVEGKRTWTDQVKNILKFISRYMTGPDTGLVNILTAQAVK